MHSLHLRFKGIDNHDYNTYCTRISHFPGLCVKRHTHNSGRQQFTRSELILLPSFIEFRGVVQYINTIFFFGNNGTHVVTYYLSFCVPFPSIEFQIDKHST